LSALNSTDHTTREPVRKGGDSGHPIVLEAEQSSHAKSMFAFAHKVIERTKELHESAARSVIEIR